MCSEQAGFRKNSSTSVSISKLLDKIISGVDEGTFGLCVFLDLKKAFDMVDHDILLSKLSYYGIRGNVLNLFKSYLTNRKQYVYMNGFSSDFSNISRGVPQGSSLSALIFLLFINDIVCSSDKLFFNLFADDTSIYLKDETIENIYNVMNEELFKVGEWLAANKLSLNVDKTIYILFRGRRKVSHFPGLYIYGSPIERKDSAKFLGIFIDEHLSWKIHANFVISKLSRTIGIIRKLQENLTASTLKTLYYSFIQPSIQFGIIF